MGATDGDSEASTSVPISAVSRSQYRKRHVWRRVPERTNPRTLFCRAHISNVRGSTFRYWAASVAVSHSFIASPSDDGRAGPQRGARTRARLKDQLLALRTA